jgi:N-acetylneuraminic acid mutarotase
MKSVRILVASVIAVAVFAVAVQGVAYATVSITWTSKTNMPIYRYDPEGGVIGGEWYLAGGSGTDGVGKNTLQAYDFASDSWTTLANMHDPRNDHGAVAHDSLLYAFGGCSYWNVFYPSLEIYDPLTNTWSYGAEMPVSLRYFASGVIGDDIYAAGGEVAGNWGVKQNKLYRYDIPTDTWTQEINMPQATYHCGGVGFNGKFYVFGGLGGDDSPISTAQVYDPSTASWTLLPNMLEAVQLPTATVLNGKIYVISNTPHLAVQVFVPVTNQWEYADAPPLTQDAAATMYGNSLYVTDAYNTFAGTAVPEPGTLALLAPALLAFAGIAFRKMRRA